MDKRLILIAVLLAAGVASGEDSIIDFVGVEPTDHIEAIEARILALEEKVEAIENPNTDGTIFFDSSGVAYYTKDGVRFCLFAGHYWDGQWEECAVGGDAD